MSTGKIEGDYILGTDPEELERLGVQHETWRARVRAQWERAGFGRGDTILDVGCGPGFATLDLAELVGASGRVIAIDRSPGFVDRLARERDAAGLEQVQPRLGELEALDLAPESLDGAWARWVFAWLERPALVLGTVARALRPGGTFAVLEYLDWAAMRMVPESDAFDLAISACVRSWPEGGAEIDIARRLPTLAAEAGLEVVQLVPVARAGRSGSPEWIWITGFLASYLPRLVERKLLTESGRVACLEEIQRREEGSPDTHLITPMVAELILRKPGQRVGAST